MTIASSQIIAETYFRRFAEALEIRFPGVTPPAVGQANTLEDFFLMVRKLYQNRQLPGLGFEFGRRLRVQDYGVVGLAMASTRNLSEAFDVQFRFLGIISNTARVTYRVSRSNRWLTLCLHEVEHNRKLDPFTIESELGAQLRFVQDLLPSVSLSRCVLSLPYACPTTRNEYRELCGCQVKFDQPAAMLKLPGSWADRSLDSADEFLAPMLAQRCQMILKQLAHSDDWVFRVRNFLLTSASPGKSLNQTAEALGVSTANLRWHLSKSGATYKQILLDVRMTLACQYLVETPLTLQEISYQLGYKYASNFQLAFKRTFAQSPGEFRKGQG